MFWIMTWSGIKHSFWKCKSISMCLILSHENSILITTNDKIWWSTRRTQLMEKTNKSIVWFCYGGCQCLHLATSRDLVIVGWLLLWNSRDWKPKFSERTSSINAPLPIRISLCFYAIQWSTTEPCYSESFSGIKWFS